jgi:hypothetical protein
MFHGESGYADQRPIFSVPAWTLIPSAPGWGTFRSIPRTFDAEVDLEMKAKAPAACEMREKVQLNHCKEDISLMQFLQAL